MHTHTHARTHAHTHTHTGTRTHTHTGTRIHKYTDYTRLIQNLMSHIWNGQQTETWFGGRQQHGTENMSGVLFWERNVLRFDLKKPRERFCRRGKGRSFYAEGPNTEKVREPTVEESCGWEYQKQSGDQGRVCEDEASHRDKTEQCA